ncbi:MAG: plasmid replication protein, CyRepA1 family, partial [Rivularia sp. (in: cyanobacteria)]
ELGLNHLSTSSTCRDRRSFILKTLEVKLKECLENGGLVIVADADFTDISYDYLKAITRHTPYIVQHDFTGDPWEINFFTGKRDLFLTQIEDWISNPDCEPIAIAMDNQAECEALTNHLIKKYSYLKNKVGGLIRIDSKITQTDFGKDFVKHTNQRIKDYLPKILLYTPSLGVGCSIDVHHFKHVFGLFYGNLEPSQARQMLARVRESVPRSVWSKLKANNSEDTPTSYLPSEIKKRLFSNQKSATEVIGLALQLAKEKAENSDIDDKEILPLLIEQLQSMMGDGGWDNAHVDLYCKQIARRNYSLNQLAVQLRQELIDEGHTLTDVVIDEATVTGDSVRFEKDEIKHQKAEKTAKAADIPLDEALRIKNQPTRTEEDEHKSTKALLKRELPAVELTKDFLYKTVYKDDRRWLNQVKLFWMATNPDITKQLDSQEWRRKLKQFSKGVAYIPDVKSYSHKVEVIKKTGLLDFLNSHDEELTEDSPKIQKFFKDCQIYRKQLKSAFGIYLTKDYPAVKLLNRLLEKVGLKMVTSRIEQQNKAKKRYYKLNQELLKDPDRNAIIESLNLKFKNDSAECPQNQLQQAEQRRQEFDISYNKNETSVSENKPVNEVIQNVVFTDENTADILRGASDWGEITLSQEQINEAWDLLTEQEQARLHGLFEEYQRDILEKAVSTQALIKAVGFGIQHYKQYQILKVLGNGFVWVRRLFGDKGECEIPLMQLAI